MSSNTTSIVQDDITAALAGLKSKTLVFEPVLESQYRKATDGRRTRHYQVWLWSVAVINTPLVLVAAQADPKHFLLALFLQWCIIIPFCLAGASALPRMPPVFQVSLAALLNGFVVFTFSYLASLAPEPYASRYFMAAGITIMCANIVQPAVFRQSVLATLPAITVFTFIGAGGFGGYNLPHNAAIIGFILMLVAVSLRVRHGMDKIARRNYLLGLRDRLLVEELSRANDQLAAIAATDGLTGVANRRFFDAALERCWEAAVNNGTPLSVIMVDIDHFKSFNDAAGHGAGDECLRHVARTIGASVRTGLDMVARYGGEEFAVILPNACLEDARHVAERVQRAVLDAGIQHLGKPGNADGHGIITVSIGVAQAALQGNCGPDHVLKKADNALYRAKVAGRNRIALAGP